MRVISVVGFLGSGKTTTIAALARHLTSQCQRVAFLINDVGEVQIDGAVIRAGGHEVVEIYGGCLCLMQDDLYIGLNELAAIPGLDWVIIEPAGTADAARMCRLLERFPRLSSPEIAARYRFQCRLGIVDAARYRLLMRSVPHLIRTSVRTADVVLLNKTDSAAPAETTRIQAELGNWMKPNAALEMTTATAGLPPAIIEKILGTGHHHV